eukprot:TRINITY_DN4334_c0_g1_i3.p1 TRINITY_DN4334_c0_g1~~TRINITY_DN4334_c0_g1_i3.p1  ORF type:complete len:391 (-),score=35.97 TRINITY_DN4334_c0_g1_i3:661-1746(-)
MVHHHPGDHPVLELDGMSLTLEALQTLQTGRVRLGLSEEAWKRVDAARGVVEGILARKEVVYGINTGFGNFADVVIAPDKLQRLQENLIRSHSVGVGEPLSPARTRLLLALRINCLAKGHSGITRRTLQQLIDAFNASCLSLIPEKGTVGASGDLAPLAHLALGLMGEGCMWDEKRQAWGDAMEVLQKNNLQPITLAAKEGLALINGTQFMTALGAEALSRAISLIQVADGIAALSLEALKGTVVAFREDIHKGRPHRGQQLCAQHLRSVLHSEKYPSEIYVSHSACGRVQDSYTLRCIPQVHGVVYDTLEFVRGILETEMNAATDNPMVFPNDISHPIVSGGNFHGEYPGLFFFPYLFFS